MPQGFALESAASVEVIAAYSAPQIQIPAVSESPGWRVVGAFYLPKSAKCRLDILALVSDPSLTLHARLYELKTGTQGANQVVTGALVQTQSIVPKRSLSSVVSLVGNRNYQIHIEVTGGAGEGLFGLIHNATITD
jgi:hypothetical protein